MCLLFSPLLSARLFAVHHPTLPLFPTVPRSRSCTHVAGILFELTRGAQALPFLWPEGWMLRTRMVVCGFVLVFSRICNMLIPLCYKVPFVARELSTNSLPADSRPLCCASTMLLPPVCKYDAAAPCPVLSALQKLLGTQRAPSFHSRCVHVCFACLGTHLQQLTAPPRTHTPCGMLPLQHREPSTRYLARCRLFLQSRLHPACATALCLWKNIPSRLVATALAPRVLFCAACACVCVCVRACVRACECGGVCAL